MPAPWFAFTVALSFFIGAFADYGDLKIYEGGKSGGLLFDDDGGWIPICKDKFDDNAGRVACRQLGYGPYGGLLSYEVQSILGIGPTTTAAVCHIYCKGGEDNVTDCDIKLGCHCENVVGVSCTDDGSLVSIAIAVGVPIILGMVIILCMYCFIRCYRKRKSQHTNHRVAQRTPRRVYMRAATAISDDTTYNEAPPAYIPDSGYQPYPAEAPLPAKNPDC